MMHYFKYIKNILSKAVVIYFAAGLIIFVIVDSRKATMERLNLIGHWGDYPASLDKGEVSFNEQSLRMAIRYYKLVSDIIPQNGEPYSMIGYCYFKLGDNLRAIKYYKKAKIRENTHFWYDYNLGMLYLRNMNNTLAFQSFQNTIEHDFYSSEKASILAPLRMVSPQQREFLVYQAVNFTEKIREYSFKMLIKMNLARQQYAEVMTMAMYAMKDPGVSDKNSFLLYSCAAAYGAKKLEDSKNFCQLAVEHNPEGKWEKAFYLLVFNGHLDFYPVLWNQFLHDSQVFPQEERGVVLHPWSFYVQPGKEIYF